MSAVMGFVNNIPLWSVLNVRNSSKKFPLNIKVKDQIRIYRWSSCFVALLIKLDPIGISKVIPMSAYKYHK